MSYNTIKLKKYVDIIEEFKAHETITPGMLLSLNSDNEVQKHASAGMDVNGKMFALEDELQGHGLDDNYAAGDVVQVWCTVPGENVYAILADGENVAIGDALESNGAGYLRKHTADSAGIVEYPNAIVAIALEAKDLSGSSGEETSEGTLGYNKRIKVKIV